MLSDPALKEENKDKIVLRSSLLICSYRNRVSAIGIS